IYRGVGNGTFVLPETHVTVGPITTDVALGDLNNDGRLDFVTTNGNSTASIRLSCLDAVPVVTVPGAQTVAEDSTLTFAPSSSPANAITVSDPALGANSARATLAVAHGSLSLMPASISLLTFSVGDGADDPTMTFTGSLTNVNAALNG